MPHTMKLKISTPDLRFLWLSGTSRDHFSRVQERERDTWGRDKKIIDDVTKFYNEEHLVITYSRFLSRIIKLFY